MTSSAEVPRDRWGRPMIMQPDGSKVAYTRASTFSGFPDDTRNLTKWKQRKTAHGLSLRPDLQLRVVSLGPEPDRVTDEREAKSWKSRMDEVCDSALEAAGGSTAATIGSALHSFTDRIDQGLELGNVPDAYVPHLQAYQQATKDLTAVGVEQFVVCDKLKVAGTFDRLVQVDGHDQLVIADTKSGSTDYPAKIAIQMATYAHGQHYDPTTGRRHPLGGGRPINQDRGLIIALNALRGTCELIWVDLQAGWRGAQTAAAVRDWRSNSGKQKLLRTYQSIESVPLELPLTPTPQQEQARDLTVEARVALEKAIRTAAGRDELVQLWTAAGTAWQPQHDDMVKHRLAELAQQQESDVA